MPAQAIAALGHVFDDDVPHTIRELAAQRNQLLLDLERSRMQNEDYREGNGHGIWYTDFEGVRRYVTWRQTVENMNEVATEAATNIRRICNEHINGTGTMDAIECVYQIRAETNAVLDEEEEEEEAAVSGSEEDDDL